MALVRARRPSSVGASVRKAAGGTARWAGRHKALLVVIVAIIALAVAGWWTYDSGLFFQLVGRYKCWRLVSRTKEHVPLCLQQLEQVERLVSDFERRTDRRARAFILSSDEIREVAGRGEELLLREIQPEFDRLRKSAAQRRDTVLQELKTDHEQVLHQIEETRKPTAILRNAIAEAGGVFKPFRIIDKGKRKGPYIATDDRGSLALLHAPHLPDDAGQQCWIMVGTTKWKTSSLGAKYPTLRPILSKMDKTVTLTVFSRSEAMAALDRFAASLDDVGDAVERAMQQGRTRISSECDSFLKSVASEWKRLEDRYGAPPRPYRPRSEGKVLFVRQDGKVLVNLGDADGLRLGSALIVRLSKSPIVDRVRGRTLGYEEAKFRVEAVEARRSLAAADWASLYAPTKGDTVKFLGSGR